MLFIFSVIKSILLICEGIFISGDIVSSCTQSCASVDEAVMSKSLLSWQCLSRPHISSLRAPAQSWALEGFGTYLTFAVLHHHTSVSLWMSLELTVSITAASRRDKMQYVKRQCISAYVQHLVQNENSVISFKFAIFYTSINMQIKNIWTLYESI